MYASGGGLLDVPIKELHLLLLLLQTEENADSAKARQAIEQIRTKEGFNNVLFACFVKKVCQPFVIIIIIIIIIISKTMFMVLSETQSQCDSSPAWFI